MKYVIYELNNNDIDKFIILNDVLLESQTMIGDSYDIVKQAYDIDNGYIKNCFDRIGIDYIEILYYPTISYRIADGTILQLSDLSSGERDYLYALCCKRLDKYIIMSGVYDRLSQINKDKFYNDFKNTDGIIMVMNCLGIPKEDIVKIGDICG